MSKNTKPIIFDGCDATLANDLLVGPVKWNPDQGEGFPWSFRNELTDESLRWTLTGVSSRGFAFNIVSVQKRTVTSDHVDAEKLTAKIGLSSAYGRIGNDPEAVRLAIEQIGEEMRARFTDAAKKIVSEAVYRALQTPLYVIPGRDQIAAALRAAEQQFSQTTVSPQDLRTLQVEAIEHLWTNPAENSKQEADAENPKGGLSDQTPVHRHMGIQHGERLKHALENAAKSISSHPPELTGILKKAGARPSAMPTFDELQNLAASVGMRFVPHTPREKFEEVILDRSLVEAAIREIRTWKVDKGGDDQVVLNLEASVRRQVS